MSVSTFQWGNLQKKKEAQKNIQIESRSIPEALLTRF